ncbi:MAG: T9SS type A sorting domain-containing protein, partial [Bacteroidales bacterium]|nr:T9SS type A sorting domain-containing protein [Bacteroidales bacterium]
TVSVYSIAGTLVAEKVISGTSTIALAKGVYIVKAADKVTKVIVK